MMIDKMAWVLAACAVSLAWADNERLPTQTAEPRERPAVDLDVQLPKEQTVEKPKVNQLYLGEGLEADMNKALLSRDWQALKGYLDAYVKLPNYDVLAYQYALGAWHRSQGNYHQAIALYRQILAKQPQADYLRFDLGIMAFENKQYQDAKKYLLKARSGLEPQLQAAVDYYVWQADKRQAPDFDVNGNYERNNNVNQASSATVIQWRGKSWVKNDDDLPKTANGIRYGANVSQDINVVGNHFVGLRGDIQGVHYWDVAGYNEQSMGVQAGYQFLDLRQSLSLMPFFDRVWLDGKYYSDDVGVALGFGRQLNPYWRVNINSRYAQKTYQDDSLAKNYDGERLSHNVMVSRRLTPYMMMFAGADFNQERTKDKEKASERKGVSVGVVAEHDSGVGGRLSLRYAKRDFKAPNWAVNITRQDKEYHLQSAFWYNKLQYKGFMPQLNVRYHRTDSNIPELFSKDGVQTFISIERRF